jgi:hypothetical protein
MIRFAPLFAVALLGLSFAATATDVDPGYGDTRPYFSGGRVIEREYLSPLLGASGQKPLYYRPTMRYYGNGYTVSYRYIPVYATDTTFTRSSGNSTNFRTEAFHIPTDEIPSWGVNSPRLVVKDSRLSPSRAPVTSIIRKKTTSKGKGAPTETPTDLPAAAPAPAPTPTPEPAPAPAPVQPKP